MVAIAAMRYQESLTNDTAQSDAWNLATCDWVTAATVSVCSRSESLSCDCVVVRTHLVSLSHTHTHFKLSLPFTHTHKNANASYIAAVQ